MKFSSGMEMYDFIASGVDLYHESLGVYVFVYNDAGALCFYELTKTEADVISRKAKETGEYWGAFLGIGGYILDNMEYDKFRYSENDEERALYLKPSFEFCEKLYRHDGWISTYEK